MEHWTRRNVIRTMDIRELGGSPPKLFPFVRLTFLLAYHGIAKIIETNSSYIVSLQQLHQLYAVTS